MTRCLTVFLAAGTLVGLGACFDPSETLVQGDDDAGTSSTGAHASSESGAPPAQPLTTSGAAPVNETSGGGHGSSGGESTGEGDSGPPDAACPEDHACVVGVPEGWTGPVLLSLEDAPCPAAYPAALFEGVSDLEAPPATCGCACDGSSLCGPVTVGHLSGCTFPEILYDTDWLQPSGECIALSADPDAQSVNLGLFDEGQGGGCEAVASIDIAEPTWGTSARVCGGAFLPDGCAEAEACAPVSTAGFEPDVCIAREGVSGCPGGYPVPRTFVSDVQDTRGCSACECGPATGNVACLATVRLSDSADCSNAVVSDVVVDAPVCQLEFTSMDYGRVESMQVQSGGCEPSGGTPTGDAIPTDEMTVCCRT